MPRVCKRNKHRQDGRSGSEKPHGWEKTLQSNDVDEKKRTTFLGKSAPAKVTLQNGSNSDTRVEESRSVPSTGSSKQTTAKTKTLMTNNETLRAEIRWVLKEWRWSLPTIRLNRAKIATNYFAWCFRTVKLLPNFLVGKENVRTCVHMELRHILKRCLLIRLKIKTAMCCYLTSHLTTKRRQSKWIFRLEFEKSVFAHYID